MSYKFFFCNFLKCFFFFLGHLGNLLHRILCNCLRHKKMFSERRISMKNENEKSNDFFYFQVSTRRFFTKLGFKAICTRLHVVHVAGGRVGG